MEPIHIPSPSYKGTIKNYYYKGRKYDTITTSPICTSQWHLFMCRCENNFMVDFQVMPKDSESEYVCTRCGMIYKVSDLWKVVEWWKAFNLKKEEETKKNSCEE